MKTASNRIAAMIFVGAVIMTSLDMTLHVGTSREFHRTMRARVRLNGGNQDIRT